MSDKRPETRSVHELHERSIKRFRTVYEGLAKWERENAPVRPTRQASRPDDRSDPSGDRETVPPGGASGKPGG